MQLVLLGTHEQSVPGLNFPDIYTEDVSETENYLLSLIGEAQNNVKFVLLKKFKINLLFQFQI